MAQIFCQGVVPEKVQVSELKDYCSVWRLLRNHRKILNSLFIPSVKLTKLSKLFIFKDWTSHRESESVSHSVMSNSFQPHGLQPARLLCPWSSPGKNTRVGSHSVLQGSSQHRDRTWVSCIARRFLTIWATREACRYYNLHFNGEETET